MKHVGVSPEIESASIQEMRCFSSLDEGAPLTSTSLVTTFDGLSSMSIASSSRMLSGSGAALVPFRGSACNTENESTVSNSSGARATVTRGLECFGDFIRSRFGQKGLAHNRGAVLPLTRWTGPPVCRTCLFASCPTSSNSKSSLSLSPSHILSASA
jgi:hypothetical protein